MDRRQSRPPNFPFFDSRVYDSDTILEIPRLPRALTIIGSGTIGCEYACILKVLGLSHVRVITSADRLLSFADGEITSILQDAMTTIGVELVKQRQVEKVTAGSSLTVTLQDGKQYESEAVLVALGRRSNVEGLALDRAGVRVDEHGQLEVNERFQTNVPHIYAAGDVIGGVALSSTAMEEARMAMVNAFDLRYKSGVARHLPTGVWTIPELSMVGETEQSLRHKKQSYVAVR